MHVKKGDKVKVIAGDDKGATGEVVKAFPKTGKIIVSGVNKIKKHRRATRAGQKGQTVEMEMPMNASNVALASKK